MFSSRLRQGQSRNPLTLALEKRRIDGSPFIDLTLSNPTRAGFAYPPSVVEGLAQDRALIYDPNPFGLFEARQAVSNDFHGRGVRLSPERIFLTASTSEAYSFLFKLLCNAGDVVLAPRPSYPLIEHLTDLDEVSVEHYSLEFHGRWTIDVDGLREKLETLSQTRRVPAIVLISPNNPTGSVVSGAELTELRQLALEYRLALVADEVFADYLMSGAAAESALGDDQVLTFGMGGLSKTAGLPQLKLAWTGVSGPPALVEQAMEKLETICDAYLSVSTPVQLATPLLLETAASIRSQIQTRVRENLSALEGCAQHYPACTAFPVEGGWSAVVQVPAVESEEKLVLRLLERCDLLVYPGYFFDFEREAFLVLSLLPDRETFSAGVERLFGSLGTS